MWNKRRFSTRGQASVEPGLPCPVLRGHEAANAVEKVEHVEAAHVAITIGAARAKILDFVEGLDVEVFVLNHLLHLGVRLDMARVHQRPPLANSAGVDVIVQCALDSSAFERDPGVPAARPFLVGWGQTRALGGPSEAELWRCIGC